mgnify:CR=1 FL=1
MLILAASLFFTTPAPLNMPRAEAYLVQEDGRYRLEDRYQTMDLWLNRAVMGRWEDDEGRTFILSRLDVQPPPLAVEAAVTRVDYAKSLVSVGRKDDLRPSLELLSPVGLAQEPRPPRQLPRGFRDVEYWHHPTNYSAIVCAFLPEKCRHWYLATWQLADGDDYSERMLAFEQKFLDPLRRGTELPPSLAAYFAVAVEESPRPRKRRGAVPSERELLRVDAHHNVTNYVNWHAVDSDEFTVLTDMPRQAAFLVSLTNDLKTMRGRYADVLPTKIDGTNVLCVARIFADREEYLDAVDEDMAWTAAYWSPERRELVAYLPYGGEQALIRTIRHEAFHQYLSYATSMIPASPWLNEGYAQYFEDEKSRDWGREFDPTEENLAKFAASLPGILAMDYAEFYDGSDIVRRFKYRLAWSVAVFLEQGADKVRFQPFKTVKQDYFKELFSSQDMRKATAAAFKNADTLKLFVAEWRKFWQNP